MFSSTYFYVTILTSVFSTSLSCKCRATPLNVVSVADHSNFMKKNKIFFLVTGDLRGFQSSVLTCNSSSTEPPSSIAILSGLSDDHCVILTGLKTRLTPRRLPQPPWRLTASSFLTSSQWVKITCRRHTPTKPGKEQKNVKHRKKKAHLYQLKQLWLLAKGFTLLLQAFTLHIF